MKRTLFTGIVCSLSLSIFLGGCGTAMQGKSDTDGDTGPKPSTVEPDMSADNFKVEHPERFPLVSAARYDAAPELNVTGVVSVDTSRQVPIPSLASGRVTEVDARLGDEVKKGQLLFKVRSTDISGAISDYRKAVENQQLAVKNEHLTQIQLERASTLYDKGAVPKSSLEIADNAEEANKTALENAKVDVATTEEHLQLLGAKPTDATGIVEVFAPVSGVITDQQVTTAAGIQALTPPNPFTISDISHVWIICDVYENNMAQVHLGEYADIRLAAYPNRVLKGRISNILPIVDPNIRTAKVRLEVENPGLMRLGMFVTATFHGTTEEKRASVPATAILHLHDRQWVYVPAGNGAFRRVEVVGGSMLPGSLQEIISGIRPGDQVVSNALVFQNTVEQ